VVANEHDCVDGFTDQCCADGVGVGVDVWAVGVGSRCAHSGQVERDDVMLVAERIDDFSEFIPRSRCLVQQDDRGTVSASAEPCVDDPAGDVDRPVADHDSDPP